HPPPLRSPLFPYTTLFRSSAPRGGAAPRCGSAGVSARGGARQEKVRDQRCRPAGAALAGSGQVGGARDVEVRPLQSLGELAEEGDRKSTRLNSSHVSISYA